MKAIVAPIAVFAAAILTAPALSQGVTSEQAAANRQADFDALMASADGMRQSHQCPAASAEDEIRKNLKSMENVVIATDGGYDYLGREAKSRHIRAAFAVADAALSQKCLDLADSIYRGIIELYSGAVYNGIRDRAMIGIEDVRAARVAVPPSNPKPKPKRH